MLRRPTFLSTELCLTALFSLITAPLWAANADSPDLPGATKSISDLAQTALAYAAVLAAASTVAMAFVELIKALTDLRSRFQKIALNQWLGAERPAILPELLYLAIGDKSHESVLCGQPIEKMMGQLQAAARIALDYPEEFPKLFAFLTSSDLETAPEKSAVKAVAPQDRLTWTHHAKSVRDLSQHLKSAAPDALAQDRAEIASTASDAAQARARLASLVGRKLDGLQLRVDFWWSRTNQALGIVVSVILVEMLVVPHLHLEPATGWVLGLLGGLLAPFAKDFSQSLATFASK
jgi:hypothetical protein